MSTESRNQPEGFTVMELMLAVLAFLLLLSVVLIFAAQQQAKRRDVARTANINQMRKALDLYATEFQQYPIFTGCITGDDNLTKELRQKKYFAQDSRIADPQSPVERAGCYYYSSEGASYQLRYVLETDSVESKGEHVVSP